MLPTHKALVHAWKCEQSMREVICSPHFFLPGRRSLCLQGLFIFLPVVES